MLEKAGQINQYNKTHKDLDKTMKEANQIVAGLEGLADRRSIVLYNEDWHKGVMNQSLPGLTGVCTARRSIDTHGMIWQPDRHVPLAASMYTKPSSTAGIYSKISADTPMLPVCPMKVENVPLSPETLRRTVLQPAGTDQRRHRRGSGIRLAVTPKLCQ